MMFVLNTSTVKNNPMNTLYPFQTRVADLKSFKSAVLKDHGFCTFTANNVRRNECFVCSTVLFGDIDNSHSEDPTEWVSLQDIQRSFSKVELYVATSKSHMKEKDGKAARPKFHLYFPIPEITSVEDYQAHLRTLIKVYEHLHFDPACKDAARHFGATVPETETYYQPGRPLTEILPTPTKEDREFISFSEKAASSSVLRTTEQKTSTLFDQHKGKSHGRKDALYSLACSGKVRGLTEQQTLEECLKLNATFQPPKTREEVKEQVTHCWKNASVVAGTPMVRRVNPVTSHIKSKEVVELDISVLFDKDAFLDWFIHEFKLRPTKSGYCVTVSGVVENVTNLADDFIIAIHDLRNRFGDQLVGEHKEWKKRSLLFQADNDSTEAFEDWKRKNLAPPKNIQALCYLTDQSIISPQTITSLSNRYTRNHLQHWLEEVRKSIKVSGDYLTEFDSFRESLKLTVFEAKAISKWVQNIKKRTMGQTTGAEFALIFTGKEQGTGKSLFPQFLLSQVSDSVRTISPDALTDKDVLGSMANTPAMIIDEFKISNRSDLETLKRVITSKSYDYRQAYSKEMVGIKPITSFFCSSNEELSDLIFDTENRRFYEIPWNSNRLGMVGKAVHEYYKTLNWVSFFNSVPLDDDVWDSEMYEHFQAQAKANVKAEDLLDFFKEHPRTIRELCIDPPGGPDSGWVSSTAFLNVYNKYRIENEMKIVHPKMLRNDMLILNCPKGVRLKNRINCYYIENTLKEFENA